MSNFGGLYLVVDGDRSFQSLAWTYTEEESCSIDQSRVEVICFTCDKIKNCEQWSANGISNQQVPNRKENGGTIFIIIFEIFCSDPIFPIAPI